MKVYTNNKFTGHWPVGTAAVVVAESAVQAMNLLNIKLAAYDLPADAEEKDMVLVVTSKENVRILCDGNY